MNSSHAKYPLTDYTLASVRTLQVLEALAFEPLTVPRLAEGLGIHPRTVRRMIAALQAARYVEQRPGATRSKHAYLPTLRLLSLSVQLTRHHPAVAQARRLVSELRKATALAAYAVMPTHDQVVVIARSGIGAPEAWTVLGARDSAAGQVLLAHHQRWRDQMSTGKCEQGVAAMTRERGYALAKEPGGQASPAAAVHVANADEPEIAVALTGAADLVRVEERTLARSVMAAVATVRR